MSDKYSLIIDKLKILIYKRESYSNISIGLVSGGNYDYRDQGGNKVYVYIQDTSRGDFLDEKISILLTNILKSLEELHVDYIKYLSRSEIIAYFVNNSHVYEASHAKNAIINSIRNIYDINKILVNDDIDLDVEALYHGYTEEYDRRVYTYKPKRSSNKNKSIIITSTVLSILAVGIIYLFVINPTLINDLISNNIISIISISQRNNNTTDHKSSQPSGDALNDDTSTNIPPLDSTSGTSNSNILITNPYIKTYTHEELIQYALELINIDRAKHNLPPVTLGKNIAAQKHAEDMLKYKYISHWDSNGFKPYMRYTQYNGKGEVSENVAITGYYDKYGSTDCYKLFVLCEKIDPMKAIENLHYRMVYDDADSNWGHRDNILNKWHNKVNIGIAYDDYFLVLVQHFENDYIEWDTLHISNSYVVQSGRIYMPISNNTKPIIVAIYYDPLPKKMTAYELNSTPSCYSYGGGVMCGSEAVDVIYPPPPPGYYYSGFVHVADRWIVDGNYFYIEYPITFTKDGVYTFLLISEIDYEQVPLASYSIVYKDGNVMSIDSITN